MALALLGGAADSLAAAKTYVVRCDGCTTAVKRSTALAQQVTTNANVYILDLKLTGPVMTGFYVYRANQPNVMDEPESKIAGDGMQKTGGGRSGPRR